MILISIEGREYKFLNLGELRKFLDKLRRTQNEQQAYTLATVRRYQITKADTRKIKIRLR